MPRGMNILNKVYIIQRGAFAFMEDNYFTKGVDVY